MITHRRLLYLLIVPLLIAVLSLVISEAGRTSHETPDAIRKDTLRCAIGDNRGNYFLYRAEPTGYQLGLIRKFAKTHRCKYKIEIVPSLEERKQKLMDGTIDVMICSRNEFDAYAQSDELMAAFSLPNGAAWVVDSDNAEMANMLSLWMAQYRPTQEYKELQERYVQSFVNISAKPRYTSLSPYDTLIKKYARDIGWDWRLLAALICEESRFNPDIASYRGAYGLMQVLPQTAERFGISDISLPENNIAAGVRWLKYLDRSMKFNDTCIVNRQKFVLAAYNAGNGRINDCRAFAVTQGKNPDNWDEVASVIPLMRYEVHYAGEFSQFGRFKGTETLNFVYNVWERYENYLNLVVE